MTVNLTFFLLGTGKAVPCVYALLPDKEKVTYLRVAEIMLQHLEESEEQLKVTTIMMDFEKSMNAAFRSTFEDVKIVGCHFHWKSALRKRIAAEGLMILYNSNDNFHNLVRYIWALAYVPVDQVIPIWEKFIRARISENFPEWEQDWGDAVKSFVKYIDTNWIGELNPRTKSRKRPGYPTEMWNKYEATLEGQPRTNNNVEAYNRAFSLSVPANATVWSLVDRFLMEESLAKQSLLQAARGNGSPEEKKSRTIQQASREAEFQAAVDNFGKVPLKLYLQNLLNFFD
jgi:MULE transposase domain